MANSQGFGKRIFAFVALLFLVVLVCAPHAHAQGETATITGTATDASGGAVAAAKIEATNTATNTSSSTVTDAAGRYKLADVPVGTYNIQASANGFKTVIHSGLTLGVGGAIVVDFSLPVGQITQTVNVEGDVSRVETTTSEVSTLVAPQEMRDLPLNGRNFEQLLTLAPGVTPIPAAANFVTGITMYGAQTNYSVSGSRPSGQAFLLDNTDIRDFWEHGSGSGATGSSLGVEAIGEFQILTNTYTAQFGGNGAVINAVSRSGTNDFHGTVYEFLRNSDLDASDYFDLNHTPPPFERNQFGGDVGGPIKKDKLFFFGNYEGFRQKLGESIPKLGILEPYVADGLLPCGPPGAPTFIPVNTTQAAACGAAAGTDASGFWPAAGTAGNPNLSVPPADGSAFAANAETTAGQIAQLYKLCTSCVPTSGDLGGYYQATATQDLISPEDYAMGRVDYNIGTNDSIFSRYTFDDTRQINNPEDPLGIFPEFDNVKNQFLTITEKHVISPTAVNALRFGFTRVNENSHTALGLSSAQLTDAGLTSDPLDFIRTPFDEPDVPDGVSSPDFFDAIAPLGPNADRPYLIVQNKFSGGDDLSWTHGAHSLKVGALVARVQTNVSQVNYAAGTDYFLNFSLVSFLQGTPFGAFTSVLGDENSSRDFREIDVMPYFQDDWKVTSRLTLNLGIRYDYITNPVGWAVDPLTGAHSTMTDITGNFPPPLGPQSPANCNIYDPNSYNPLTGTYTYVFTPTAANPTPYTCLFQPIHHVFGNNPNGANIEPRFGFAYDPFADHKTSIRGGFGVFRDPVTARTYESGIVFTPPAVSLEYAPPDTASPCFPNPFAVESYCGVSGFPQPDLFAGTAYEPTSSPYELQYNLNVQREITHGTVLSVGYVGLLARHLWGQTNINPPECNGPTPGTFTTDCTALPTAGDPTSGASFCHPEGASCVVNPLLNPNFVALTSENATGSESYNSLQVSLHREFGHNLVGQANYTWSHCIDDGSFTTSLEEFGADQVDPYNQKYDYGNCIFDIRQNVSINGIYSFPFKGNRLIEGWQFNTIFGAHSGAPLDITRGSGSLDDLSGESATRANYSGFAGCSPNQIIDHQATIDYTEAEAFPPVGTQSGLYWLNPNCYVDPPVGYIGSIRRNNVRGPGSLDWDMSLLKNTKLTERFNLQFRAEFFNILNHFNPAAPLTTLDAATSGQVLGSQAPVITPRQVQFALKLDF
jgi:Carboxypeptidase regulatory-like domain/TonB dependent receptor